MKNGDQHRTNVKKTNPRTFDAFCSVATELAARFFLLTLPVSNLKRKYILAPFADIYAGKYVTVFL